MKNGKVYIIGIDHLLQYRNGIVSADIFDEFAGYIADIIGIYNISTVAEEFNREYLDEVYFSSEAMIESAAMKAGVTHIFCDPGKKERAHLGIPYFADLQAIIKQKYGIHEKFITDLTLRKKIEKETSAESKKYWEIREEYWYSVIHDITEGNILFVCGHEHAMRFKDLLLLKGIDSEVIETFWRCDIFSDYSRLGIS
jgi:hypothetical protein